MTQPLLARARTALRVLRGDTASSTTSGDESRAIIGVTYPNQPPGSQGLSLVRTANPQEYKPDGAAVRTIGFGKHPVVHACIRVVADIVASVPLIVLREKGNSESRVPETDPLQRLLDYPNTRMSARSFRARYAVDFLGYGNAFFELRRPSPGGLPIALSSVNAESIQSVWVDSEGDPRRYDYGNWAGLIVSVNAEDMLHFKDLEMSRPFTPDVFGFPRGATALASIAADNEATHYVRQVVTNDGTPTFAVMLSDEATQDDATAMQERYRARVVDRGKRGTPAFFGAVRDIKPLGFTLSDLEFPDLRRVSREDICAAFGVDPRMIGIASASSDAGLSGVQYAEARARLVQHTIEPMLHAIEDELNHWLAPEFGDVWISYDREVLRELVENDTETSTRIRAEFAASLRTLEESRIALRLPPQPNPTEALSIPMGTTLTPAAIAVINPQDIMDQPTAEPMDAEMPVNVAVATAPIGADVEASGLALNLNGAQISSAKDIVLAVAAGQLPRDSGVAMLEILFGLTTNDAEALMGSAGLGTSTTPNVIEGAGIVTDTVSTARTIRSKRDHIRSALSDQALSGDQIEQLSELLESVVEGELPPEAVKALIQAAFPKLDVALIDQMLTAVDGFVTVPEPEDALDETDMAAPRNRWWEAMTQDELRQDPRYQYWRRAMDELDRQEQGYYTTARARFRAEAKDVASMFGVTTRATRTPAEILAELQRRIREGYAPGGEYWEQWKADYERLVGETYMVGAAQSAGSVGVSFSLQSPQVMAAIDGRLNRLATLIGDTTATQVSAAIRAGQVGGLSVSEIGRLIQATVYGETITDARATSIARTESAGAMSQGNWDQAQEMGDLYRSKEWIGFDDARISHQECMAQGVIPFEDAFTNGLQYPLDPAGDAEDVINCRCVLAYYDTPAGQGS